MRKVIVDTNFLLIPIQFGVDIFDEIQRICNFEYELAVLDKSVKELNKIISGQEGKQRHAAKLALSLIKAKKVKVIRTKSEKCVDDLLAELSKEGCVVATQDKLLKSRLKKPLITLRQRKHLQLIN